VGGYLNKLFYLLNYTEMRRNIFLKIARFKDLLLVKTIESGEKMVNISKTLKNCVCIYQQKDMIPYVGEDLWVRETVAIKLQAVANSINESHSDYRLKIVYGFRHPEIQEFYFKRRKDLMRLEYPNMSDDKLNEFVNTMTACPETAGHPTGGAVDVTIITKNGDLDVGTSISDFSNLKKIETYCESLTFEQQENRKVLHCFMISEGFAPYYGEWWHFSYGDKEWAWFYDKPNAIYSQIDFRTV